MSGFITNSGAKNLKKRIQELITRSSELRFLVGFFYFSGIRELYEGLKNNPNVILKVLVGLNVDNYIHGLVEYGTKEVSNDEKVQNFFQSVKKSINTDDFDNKEFYEQCKFFLKMIAEDKLVIRKTFEPNHAKLYIFKLEEDQIGRDRLFITGSSNLTKSGLSSQQEFNVEISDYGFEDAEKYFDDLWKNAVTITEDHELKQKLLEVLVKETLIKEITPYEAYVYVLKSYLDTFKGKETSQNLEEILKENGYKKYNYQFDAVKQALQIIDDYNGVIIADVVGLGKTVIACAVGYELKKRGIVIAPPGLIGDRGKKSGWRKYLEDFKLTSLGWEVHSLGALENVVEIVNRCKDIEVVIVDEAHRFRNEDTKDYELLKNICRNKKVMLLTATPFNNKPSDILSLLKLFVTPKKSIISLTDNLEAKFVTYASTFDKLSYIKKYHNSSAPKKCKSAEAKYKALFGEGEIDLAKVKRRAKYLAKEIRDVIEPVTIRRNRLDLMNNPHYKKEVEELSKVAPPLEWYFELTEEQSRFYDKVISGYFTLPDLGGEFKGAIYQPFAYEKGITDELEKEENFEYFQQFNLYDFMRRLIVKRFESSFGAFYKTIKNFESITEDVLAFIERTGKYILDRNLLEQIYDKDDDFIEEKLNEYTENIKKGEYPKNHKVYEIKKFKNKEAFLEDIKNDLELFEKILEETSQLGLKDNDPKREVLIKKIKESLAKEPSRKVVLFSEYIDTVKYLQPALENAFNNRVLTVAGDLTQTKISEIYKNFDASYKEQENNYDILLTTDKISEGFNLNRAGIVINYDIPWNPVRVIQRLGRINRISKKVFDELYIVNFFPTEKGADLVRSREIATNKMFLIHNTLGEDSKIFDPDEEPTPAGLYKRITQNPDELEGESFITKVVKELETIKKEHPEVLEAVDVFPTRIKVAKKADENELFVVIRKGRIYIHHKKYDLEENNHYLVNLNDVIDNIKAEYSEKPLELSDTFWDAYVEIKNYKDSIPSSKSEVSLERRATNILKTLLKINNNENLTQLKPFIKTLLEDICDYGTLSDYTLRRIANLEIEETKLSETIKEIENIKKELGEDYLLKEKERLKKISKEIIIAIENRKHAEESKQ